jgi:2-polyprenyl-6-methoxyphenol hydroxylase-like FAD-dependent oxidoreductase
VSAEGAETPPIVIAGAGIAGLALAAALQRGGGAVTVVRESATIGRLIQAAPPLGPHLHRLVGLAPSGLFARHIAVIAGRDALG